MNNMTLEGWVHGECEPCHVRDGFCRHNIIYLTGIRSEVKGVLVLTTQSITVITGLCPTTTATTAAISLPIYSICQNKAKII